MSSLYTIQNNYLYLINQIQENEGVLDEETNKLFDFTQEEFAEKAEEFCKIIRTLDTDCLGIDAEIERLTKLKANKSNLSDRLEKSLAEALKMFGTKDSKKDIWRYEFGTFKISTRKSEKTEVLKPELVPNEYKKVSIKDKLDFTTFNKIKELFPSIEGSTEFDKKAIKSHLDTLADSDAENKTEEWAEVKTNFGLSLK